MRRLRLLLFALLLATPSTHAQSYATFVARWVEQFATSPPPAGGVVFLGSSSIRRWERLSYDFADHVVVQRGIGGSTLDDLLGWVDELVVPYQPLAVVVYTGANALAPPEPPGTEQNTPQQEFEQFVDLVQAIHQQQDHSKPPIPVLYVAITPTPAGWYLWPEASQVNALIGQYAASEPSVFLVDTSAAFLATGMPPSSTFFDPDLLHLSQLGYDLWTAHVRPVLAQAVASTKSEPTEPSELALGTRILFDLGPDAGSEGSPTASPDVNGNYWNNWYPLPTGVQVLAGEARNDLVASNGTPTDIDFVMSGGWKVAGLSSGGLAAPSAALLGRFAIDSATEDCFYSISTDDPAGFYLSGLDPRRTYHLRLFASRNAPETLLTRFAVSGSGAMRSAEVQTSGAGIGAGGSPNGNVSEVAVLRNLRPDRFGQLFVDAQAAVGNTIVLNAFELEVGPRFYRDRSPAQAPLRR